jgi:hypothetical protein
VDQLIVGEFRRRQGVVAVLSQGDAALSECQDDFIERFGRSFDVLELLLYFARDEEPALPPAFLQLGEHSLFGFVHS